MPSYKPQRPGFIYAASNPSFPGLLKIGKTTHADPQKRLAQLSHNVPTPYSLEYAVAVSRLSQCEAYVHYQLYDVRVNTQREFFRVELDRAKALMDRAEHATRPVTMEMKAKAMQAIECAIQPLGT